MKTLSQQEALHKAAAYCSLSEHCCSEVEQKLIGWGIEKESIQPILRHLAQEGFIDENRYCHCFISDKLRQNKWGRNKITQSLLQKKIPEAIIRNQLEQIEQEEYTSILKDLLDSKRKSVKAHNDYEFKGKLIRFALSKGFEANEIYKLIHLPNEDEE